MRLAALTALAIPSAVLSGCTTDSGPDEYEAQVMCENFVEDRLKSPGTADFSDTTASGGPVTWTVTGNVDSENGFGALVRSNFTCEMTVDGDTWHLDDFDFQDGGSF